MLETEFCGARMKNPLVLASGILGVNTGMLLRVARNGAGAITTKSIGPREKEGNANPTVIACEHWVMNAVGLPTAGIENVEQEFLGLKNCPVPIIASVYGNSAEEYASVAAHIAEFAPAMIELNLSCPHSKGQGQFFGNEPELAEQVVRAVKEKTKIPIIAKLSANTHKMLEVAIACERAGANAIAAINSLGPGMLINIEARKPVLANKFGGLSGPAIKPIAVKSVYQIFESVKIPILGMGGITTGKDAIEMVMAGATTIGIGSAIYYRGIDSFALIAKEMQEWMQANKVNILKEIKGVAHE